MKVLIACEYSGIVRNAFTAAGHDATSCDLLPTESPGKHYQGNVFDIVNNGFDLMIAHPPCTYLCKAQYHLLSHDQLRRRKMSAAVEFVQALYAADIKHIAIENPIGILSRVFRKPDQIIYSNWFGDPHKKDICLWLKNLPPLICTCYNSRCQPVKNHTNGRMSQEQKSKIKSKFFPLVAKAMAHQWSPAYLSKNI